MEQLLSVERRLTTLEHKLDSILDALQAREASEWIDRKAACALIGVSERSMFELISKGTLDRDAVRNVGTVKRPRYRFHRAKLLSQFLSRD
tara:strand:- start:1516 stop:1788 length:273 start_codon:yes stop_codon:yes gene_type:complete